MFNKIIYILTRKQKLGLVTLCIVVMIGSLLELLGVSLIMPLTTIATNEAVIQSDEMYILFGRLLGLETAREYVIVLTALLIFVYVFKNVYISFMNYCQRRYAYRNEEKLGMELMRYYVGREYLYHTSKNVADIQRNVLGDVAQFWGAVFACTSILNEGLVCISMILYLAGTDFIVTVCITFLAMLLALAYFFGFQRYSFRLGAKLREVHARRLKWLLQTFAGIKEIKVTEKSDFFMEQYKKAYDDYVRYELRQSVISFMPKPLMETVCICGLLGVVIVRVWSGVELQAFIPTLALFVMAAFRMLPSFNRLSSYLSQLMSYKAATESVYSDIRALRMEEKEGIAAEIENPVQKNAKELVEICSDIQIQNISFKYPASQERILNNVNLIVPYKKSVALIGASGAGKTTLADIILGIIAPQEGTIMVGNINVLEYLKEWHQKIGYIPQTIYLTDDTIRNNVAFGIPETEIDDEQIYKVLEEAHLADFVRGLPEGINTMVGDRGVRLSGGQRQRIGIARALYSNPQLLVLDEATSALDTETEAAVMEAIDGLQGSCTMIIIAHRLTTIQNCDIIYEIKDGKAIIKKREEIFSE